METDTTHGWIYDLEEAVEEALEFSGIDQAEGSAVVFMAVQRLPGGLKVVSHIIRGDDLPLAEAIGTLVYNRELPEVISKAARKALAMRCKEDKARILRAARGTQRPKTHKHKPKNKNRK